MAAPVQVPLLNPNEPEAMLAALLVQEGQHVEQGDVLATLETTKSAADVAAETSGYIAGLRLEQGQTVRAGELMCYIAEDQNWKPEEPASPTSDAGSGRIPSPPADLRITQPALALAHQLGIDLKQLPTDRLVTESVLRSLEAAAGTDASLSKAQPGHDPSAIVVYGGGGHGKALIDLLRALRSYRIIGIVDDGLPAGTQIMGLTVLGGSDVLERLHNDGVRQAVNAVGGIGDISTRIQVFDRLAGAGFVCPAVIHPTAFVEPGAAVSAGVQVFSQAYVGSEARLGYGCIVNTGAIISHDCVVGDFANISPGAILAGEVEAGSGALIGMGATINLRVKIGPGARIGNGATVKGDVPEKGIVRAGAVWPA